MQTTPLPASHVGAETVREVDERVAEDTADAGNALPIRKPSVRVVRQQPAGNSFGLFGQQLGRGAVKMHVRNRFRPEAEKDIEQRRRDLVGRNSFVPLLQNFYGGLNLRVRQI